MRRWLLRNRAFFVATAHVSLANIPASFVDRRQCALDERREMVIALKLASERSDCRHDLGDSRGEIRAKH